MTDELAGTNRVNSPTRSTLEPKPEPSLELARTRLVEAANHILRDPEEAADVVHDVFLERGVTGEAGVSVAKFKELKWYVVKRAINAYNRLRVRKIDETDVDSLPQTARSPLEMVINNELAERFRQELDSLSPKQREAFQLHYYEGYKYEEIGAMLNEKPNTIAVRANEAKNRLLRVLADLRSEEVE